jgi:uncharacterized protein (DUF305 family)
MNNKTIIVVFFVFGVGITVGYLVANTPRERNQYGNETTIPAGMHRMPDGSMMGNGNTNREMGMMGDMDHGMMMVTSEKEFLTEMIPHHEEAVATAKEVLARGATTPEVRALMERIVTAQEQEIADMKTWFAAWYGTPYQPSGTYAPMMRDLTTLRGAALDKAFLEDMVMHHMGAIMMAHSVVGYLEHDELRDLTKAIIETQSAEIVEMRELRALLD